MSVPHPQTLLGWTVLVTLLVVIGWLLYARAVRVSTMTRARSWLSPLRKRAP